MHANGERLRADIEANAAFGAIDSPLGPGRTCLTGSAANREARDRFVEALTDAGLDVTIDAVGNILGTWTPQSADPEAAPVVAGSHLDSVPEGGIFDGPLGTYGALESVRVMQDAGLEPTRPVAVVSFTEEEGQTFADGLLGSSVAVGDRTVEEALALEDDDGRPLGEALEGMGYAGEGLLDPGDWHAFLELHVEQSARLERTGTAVGVVTDIAGITHCTATIEGEADHAGATPMDERTDALAAAAELVLDVERSVRERTEAGAETLVGTVGRLAVSPNATNVVPGTVELGIDVRDVRKSTMDAVVGDVERGLARLGEARDVATALERPFDVAPTRMADRVTGAIRSAAETAGIPAMDLHSGAAHDAMHVARRTDAGMLFAPSEGGYSHSPREWTDWEDCAAATTVLANAMASLAVRR